MRRFILRERLTALPFGLLGMVVSVAACERFTARHDLEFMRQDNWEWRLTARAARERVRTADVLCFGSSLVRLGIVPSVIERSTGGTVYNLGMCACPAPANYFLLRRALESGARPSVVIVELHPMGLPLSHWHTAVFWPDALDVRETLELAWESSDPRFFAAMTIARLFPTMKDRKGIQRVLRAALAGETSSTRDAILALRRNVRINQGAMLVPKRAASGDSILPADEKALPADSWSCSRLNARYVRRFLDLAESRGIGVVWVLPPVRSELQELRDRNGVDARYRRFALQMAAGRGNVVVADATRAGYPADLFIDGQHLDRDGAACLSAALGPIARSVASDKDACKPRVQLGGPHAPPGAIALEDYGASIKVVRQAAEARKAEVRR